MNEGDYYDPVTFDHNDRNGKAAKLVKNRSINDLLLFFSKPDYSPWAKMKAVKACENHGWKAPLENIVEDRQGKYGDNIKHLARQALGKMNGQQMDSKAAAHQKKKR
jgi:hypothetical protein